VCFGPPMCTMNPIVEVRKYEQECRSRLTRQFRLIRTASDTNAVILSKSLVAIASVGVNQLPPRARTASRSSVVRRLAGEMPPVGMNRRSLNTDASADSIGKPVGGLPAHKFRLRRCVVERQGSQ